LAVAEQASAGERHVHGAEVAVVAHAHVRDMTLAGRRFRTALDRETCRRAESRERKEADRAGCLDAWKFLYPIDDVVKEPDALLVVPVLRIRQLETHRQDVRRGVSEIYLAKRSEAAKQQSRADEQHDGERDFGDDERLPQTSMTDAAARLPRAVLQRFPDVGARSFQ